MKQKVQQDHATEHIKPGTPSLQYSKPQPHHRTLNFKNITMQSNNAMYNLVCTMLQWYRYNYTHPAVPAIEVSLHYTTMHYTTTLYYTATTLHYTALHYTTLHNTTQHSYHYY